MTQQEAVNWAKDNVRKIPVAALTDRGTMVFWRDEENRLCWSVQKGIKPKCPIGRVRCKDELEAPANYTDRKLKSAGE